MMYGVAQPIRRTQQIRPGRVRSCRQVIIKRLRSPISKASKVQTDRSPFEHDPVVRQVTCDNCYSRWVNAPKTPAETMIMAVARNGWPPVSPA
jgi:hypothetical protein